MEAARHAMGGTEDNSGLFASMGIPKEMWDQMRGDGTMGIWPENWSAVRVFIAMQTQWRHGMNGVTGLDYSALLAVMQYLGIRKKKQVFADLQIMEVEALDYLRLKRGG